MHQWQIVVKLRGAKDDAVFSPEMSQEDAEGQLSEIRDTLGGMRKPDLPWIAVLGKDIVGAHMHEVSVPAIG